MTSTMAAASPSYVATTATDQCCYHCHEALPPAPVTAVLDGATQRFCCAGCEAAASWILGSRLGDYYKLRTDAAARAQPANEDLSAWDDAALLATHSRAVPAGREIVLLTDGMRCAACAWLIDRALLKEPGIAEISANAMTGRIRIVWNPTAGHLSQALRLLQKLGYRAYLAGDSEREATRKRERRTALLRLGIAGLGAMQAMMFAEATYLDTAGTMPTATRDMFRWVTFLIATPVVFYSGWPFLAGAWRELRNRAPAMETLIASATLLAWGASIVETVRGGPHVWFDAAVMFVFLLLLARQLELRARNLASDQVDTLARAQPLLALRERTTQELEAVPISSLKVGDVLRVSPGDTVPADGALLDSPATLVESLLTGESKPVVHGVGDAIFAGTYAPQHSLRLRVTAAGQATRIAGIARLVQQAQENRPPLALLADRLATRFVLALLIFAAGTWLVWHVVQPERAFEVLLALLVISCPCALSLSIPAALAVAHGTLAKLGVLSVRADALEKLTRVTDIVFDKTGTLGDNCWRLVSTQTFGGMESATACSLAAALEHNMRHPLASAFRDLPRHDDARDVQLELGAGVSGTIAGRPLRIGTAAYAAGRPDDGAVWLGDGQQPMARFELQETPRSDALPTLDALRQQRIDIWLLSGDDPTAVAKFAAAVGIPATACRARQLPEDKLAVVRQLQAERRVVAMVGDGMNDAPVLAGADVSIAVANGAAMAQQAADLVLTHHSLQRIPLAISLAQRTLRVIKQNLALAVGYNLLALPLAALGLVTPWIAALAMVTSSLTVTLNALRLSRSTTP